MMRSKHNGLHLIDIEAEGRLWLEELKLRGA